MSVQNIIPKGTHSGIPNFKRGTMGHDLAIRSTNAVEAPSKGNQDRNAIASYSKTAHF